VISSWGREQFRLAADKDPTIPIEAWISLQQAERLFAANNTTYAEQKAAALSRDFTPLTLRQKARFRSEQTVRTVSSRNVLAKLPGRDPDLKKEWLIYTAHWDHLGRDERLEGDQIYNGALDNAIGTAGLLELAKAFQSAPEPPRRSILFLALTAEEQGLLGARHYANDPVYPLRHTVANINMDGLNPWGRTRDIRLVGDGNSTLEDLTAEFVEQQNRVLLPDPNPERGTFYRSDHFEFVRKGIPALYLKSGIEYLDYPPGYGEAKVQNFINNDYHKVSDEVKSDWDLRGAVEDLKLLFQVGWRVAEQDHWPKWKPTSEFKR
jgi:Zn-dependent M28 family amino/carboxypeptidase